VGDRRHRRFAYGRQAVDERNRPVPRVPALVHHALRGQHIVAPGRFVRVAGEGDHVEIGLAPALVLEIGKRIVE
jgi:hypothetical protein